MQPLILTPADWSDELLYAATDQYLLRTAELQGDIDRYKAALKAYRLGLKTDAARFKSLASDAAAVNLINEAPELIRRAKEEQRQRRHQAFVESVPARFGDGLIQA